LRVSNKEELSQSDILYYGQKTEPKTLVSDSDSGSIILVEVEKGNVEKAFENFSYQISITAIFLDMDWKTFRFKIRNYGIKPKD
jgi:hypothetical protein